MKPSNTMFADGKLDPWRSLSIHADTQLNLKALNRKDTRTVPKCNRPPPSDNIFGIVHEDAVHVPDLRRRWFDGKGPVDEALGLFGKLWTFGFHALSHKDHKKHFAN